VTCLDGHRDGAVGAAAALAIAAIGSFFAGCVATVLVAAWHRDQPRTAVRPGRVFSLMALGLIRGRAGQRATSSPWSSPLLLSMVGSDLETGAGRMTFDVAELADGIGFTTSPVCWFAEIIRNLELPAESRDIVAKVRTDADLQDRSMPPRHRARNHLG
jgi:putative tricarboxylic transport membrane protein